MEVNHNIRGQTSETGTNANQDRDDLLIKQLENEDSADDAEAGLSAASAFEQSSGIGAESSESSTTVLLQEPDAGSEGEAAGSFFGSDVNSVKENGSLEKCSTVDISSSSNKTENCPNEFCDLADHSGEDLIANVAGSIKDKCVPDDFPIAHHEYADEKRRIKGYTNMGDHADCDTLKDKINDIKENDVIDDCLGKNQESAEDKQEEDETTIDILGNGLLVKKILKSGAGRNSRPLSSDKVILKVEGHLKDGRVVDKNDSLAFFMNDGDVIHAFDLAVALMELGEECELKTAAKYAYGNLGREPDVPPDADITYYLTLLSKEDGPDYAELPVSEQLIYGEAKRERGNYLFSRRDFSGAINSYNKALTILKSGDQTADSTVLEAVIDCKIKCYNNLAACQLKVGAYQAAIHNCSEVLSLQPENVKALYRTGKAYASKGETKEAVTYLKRALKIDPSSKIAHQELYSLNKKLHQETNSEKQLYQRMMGAKGPSPQKKKKSQWWRKSLLLGAAIAVLISVGAAAYRYGIH